jgi:hypothetical protein
LQVIDILFQVVKAEVLVLVVAAEAGYFGAHLTGREARLCGKRRGKEAHKKAKT